LIENDENRAKNFAKNDQPRKNCAGVEGRQKHGSYDIMRSEVFCEVRGMATKSRLLSLLELLQQESDENCQLTTAQVRKALLEEGFPASIKTIRDDIETLRDAGYDILVQESSGLSTTYAYVGRDFETPELQILIDAVSSSQLITKDRSRKLIRKLAALATPSSRDGMEPRVLVSESIKAQNTQMVNILQKIRKGIKTGQKISFRYFTYNLHKERVPRHDGEIYVISPYATIWKDDRYYLVGFSDKRQKVVSFRIDRMDVPALTRQKSVPVPPEFSVKNYTDKITKMFDGPEEKITLRCRNERVDQIIDRFGTGVEIHIIDEEQFEVAETVAISGTFFGWLFQYAGEIEIISPQHVRNEYIQLARKIVPSGEEDAK